MIDQSQQSLRSGRVSIILLNWNGFADTVECINSLSRITYTNYEVVVVDNGSRGDDVAKLRQLFGDRIRIIENHANLGFAEGNNVGVRQVLAEGSSEFVLFLNNDTTVEADFLDRLVERAAADPKIGIVGPEIHYYHEPKRIHSRGGVVNLYTGWHFVGGSDHRPPYNDDSKFTLQYYSGCALLIRTEVLRRVGSFDSQYFYYVEDVDLGFRVHRAGYRIVSEPRSVIYHKEGASVGGSTANPLTAFYQTRNTILFIRKNGQPKHRLVFIPVLFVKMAYDYVKFFPTEKKLLGSRLKGIWWNLTHAVKAN